MARYELVEGTSKKFWEITLNGSALLTRWGRIGTEGQSKTKRFGDAGSAQKEHDALVREKTAKGYRLVSDAAPPAAAQSTASRPVRADLSIYNEATAFIVTSESMIGRQLSPDDDRWTRAVADGDLLPIELVQDDPFAIRIVVGDALNESERDEAIGQLAWKLRVPDGRLVVAGGIELVMEPPGSEVSDYLAQYSRRIDVPAGEYDATLLAYVQGINGENLLNRARGKKGEGVGAWFRRTRGGDLPVWVRFWCHADPREDKGHEDDWAEEPGKRERAKQEATEYVHFLLHLMPHRQAERTQPALEQGFFSFDAYDVRLPEKCPIGLLAAKPKDARPKTKAEEPPPPLQTINVLARMRNRKLSTVAGGPVECPIDRIGDVFRLAWLATDATDPEIRIQVPAEAGYTTASWPEIENVGVSAIEGGVRIGIGAGGVWTSLSAVDSSGKHLGSLPDGSIVDLLACPGSHFWEQEEDEPEQHADAGVQRYRGPVKNGTWFIEETFPAVDAATLRDALVLSASIAGGRKLALRDEAEGVEVQRRLESEQFLFVNNPLVIKPGEIGLRKKDVSLLHFVAARLFRTRWASVWPVYTEDEAANAEFEAAMKQLSEQLGAKLSAAAAPKGDLELVHEGKVGKFQKVDLLKQRPLEDELIEEADRQLRELGYEIVGDLVCSRFPDVIVRGYARAGGDVWGAYLAGILESSFEFVTLYEKDAGLTTTFKSGPPDEPGKGLYRSRHPKLNFRMLKKLHAEHEKRKPVLAKKLGAARPAAVDLTAFARAVDEGVSRQIA